jgi:hypothetical protein
MEVSTCSASIRIVLDAFENIKAEPELRRYLLVSWLADLPQR